MNRRLRYFILRRQSRSAPSGDQELVNLLLLEAGQLQVHVRSQRLQVAHLQRQEIEVPLGIVRGAIIH